MNTQNMFKINENVDVSPNMSALVSMSHWDDQYRDMIEETVWIET